MTEICVLITPQMMSMFNGKERTVEDFVELGEQSGWKLGSVVPGKLAALTFSPV